MPYITYTHSFLYTQRTAPILPADATQLVDAVPARGTHNINVYVSYAYRQIDGRHRELVYAYTVCVLYIYIYMLRVRVHHHRTICLPIENARRTYNIYR